MEKEKKEKKSNWLLVTILIVALLGAFAAGGLAVGLVKSVKGDTYITNTTAEKEEKETKKETKLLEGQFYLLEGLHQKRRYYLAFDNAEMMGEDNTFIDFRKKKVYLVDMNLSDNNNFIKEIDFEALIKDVYDEKINSIPDVIASGTVNETKKSECNYYKIQYTVSKYAEIAGEDQIPFGIYYACIHDYEGRKNAAELSLGTEYYNLNVPSMKVTKLVTD